MSSPPVVPAAAGGAVNASLIVHLTAAAPVAMGSGRGAATGANTAGGVGAAPQAVASIFQSVCAGCHHPGGQTPDLSVPSAIGSQFLPVIAAKINNAAAPMPPSGQLPAAQLATLNAWLSPAVVPGQTPLPLAGAPRDTLAMRWSVAGQPPSAWQRFSGSPTGTYALTLGSLPAAAALVVSVQVLDAAGGVLATKDFPNTPLPASGLVELSVSVPGP